MPPSGESGFGRCVEVEEIRCGSFVARLNSTSRTVAGRLYVRHRLTYYEPGGRRIAMRTGAQFAATRKLGRTHQQLLVFVKGNAKRATQACGPVEVEEAALTAAASDSVGARPQPQPQ